MKINTAEQTLTSLNHVCSHRGLNLAGFPLQVIVFHMEIHVLCIYILTYVRPVSFNFTCCNVGWRLVYNSVLWIISDCNCKVPQRMLVVVHNIIRVEMLKALASSMVCERVSPSAIATS